MNVEIYFADTIPIAYSSSCYKKKITAVSYPRDLKGGGGAYFRMIVSMARGGRGSSNR